jgi:hypothetical protein
MIYCSLRILLIFDACGGRRSTGCDAVPYLASDCVVNDHELPEEAFKPPINTKTGNPASGRHYFGKVERCGHKVAKQGSMHLN